MLDGTGYPLHLAIEQLLIESCNLAVADIYSALMGSQPYRQPLSPANAQQQLAIAINVPHRLDAECVDAVISVLDQLAALPLEDIPGTSTETIWYILLVDLPPFRFGTSTRVKVSRATAARDPKLLRLFGSAHSKSPLPGLCSSLLPGLPLGHSTPVTLRND